MNQGFPFRLSERNSDKPVGQGFDRVSHERVSLPWIGVLKMTLSRAIELLGIERECVSRDCDRDCGRCDLVQERSELLEMYDEVIRVISRTDFQMEYGMLMEDDLK